MEIKSNPQYLSKQYTVRELSVDDVDAIYELCSGNEQFYRYHPPFVTRESILDDLKSLPPGKTLADKLFIGFYQEDTLIAVMDLILGFPDDQTAFIGLFMMNAFFQGREIGSGIIRECLEGLSKQNYKKVRLAVDKGNPQSEHFWTKNLFVKTGEEFPVENTTLLPMERLLN